MSRTDFTKTSAQVERELLEKIDNIDRSLDSSSGENDRKNQLALGVLASFLVFASVFAFDFFVRSGDKGNALQPAPAQPIAVHAVSERDVELVKEYLARIDRQTETIRESRNRVAPAMPIDAQLLSIRDAADDLRRLIGIAKTAPIGAVSEPKAE